MAGHVLDAMGGFEHFVLAGGHCPGRASGDLFDGLPVPRSGTDEIRRRGRNEILELETSAIASPGRREP
jgi:hypothetical protein